MRFCWRKFHPVKYVGRYLFDFLYPDGYPDVQFGIAKIPIFTKQTI